MKGIARCFSANCLIPPGVFTRRSEYDVSGSSRNQCDEIKARRADNPHRTLGARFKRWKQGRSVHRYQLGQTTVKGEEGRARAIDKRRSLGITHETLAPQRDTSARVLPKSITTASRSGEMPRALPRGTSPERTPAYVHYRLEQPLYARGEKPEPDQVAGRAQPELTIAQPTTRLTESRVCTRGTLPVKVDTNRDAEQNAYPAGSGCALSEGGARRKDIVSR
ncbi:hypothetical protein [Erwinia sp. HR93]|uniref:hypothetical protein n=1 Tax=Erwinia sp. HR93 TaxID=3094840 RepID=UPI002ADEC90E|nr:hypothetical protein [Erwinia sp. HR93]MEA1063324.1 hypothetical protein [Erwinia sp. HR93]